MNILYQLKHFNPNANVNNNVKKVNEKRNIIPGAYHQFLLTTLDRDAASSNIKNTSC